MLDLTFESQVKNGHTELNTQDIVHILKASSNKVRLL